MISLALLLGAEPPPPVTAPPEVRRPHHLSDEDPSLPRLHTHPGRRARVLAQLAGVQEISALDLNLLCGMSYRNLHAALDHLLDAGKVSVREEQRGKVVWRFWRLAETPESTEATHKD